MARPLRIEYPGAVYHVTARGNARADVYLGEDDRIAFLTRLAEALDRFGWICHAYCLMTNHTHPMVETPAPNLARGMRHLNGVYTQTFNRTHGRVGHVFQGRTKAILVEREAHLLELCRTIVLNPVRAGLVARAADWRWSSYAETARRRYRAFVAEGGEAYRPWDALRGGVFLGSEAFRAAVAKRLGGGAARPRAGKVPRGQRHLCRPELARLATGADRRAWMTAANRDHGYTMAQIAAAAGLHYSSVSKIITATERTENS